MIKFINLIFKYAPASVAMRRGWDVCKYSNDSDSFVFGLLLLARFFLCASSINSHSRV